MWKSEVRNDDNRIIISQALQPAQQPNIRNTEDPNVTGSSPMDTDQQTTGSIINS